MIQPIFVISNSNLICLLREANTEPPSKGTNPFSSMEEITVDQKEIAKLLDGLYVHKAPGPDGSGQCNR